MTLSVDESSFPGASVLKLHGDMTALHEGKLEQAIAKLLEGKNARILLDMSDVRFITSNGLGELVHVAARVNTQSGRLVLVGPTPFVQDVLTTTRLDKFFEIADTMEAGLAKLS